MHQQRRDFLRMTAAGAAGLALVRADKAHAAWPGTGTLAINPDISNMRVVSCVDPQMLSTPKSTTFAAENAAVDACRVHANMDAMAMQLADKTTADDAWKTIFRPKKDWASAIVAIKVNVTEPANMPRVAVVEKFCRVFAGLGVPASNIIIYDGGPSSFAKYVSNYASYFSATDTSKIPGVLSNISDALGGTTNASLPDGTSATCTADIAKGKVDILVSLAVNKGHPNFGGATLCMKNHFGTFIANHFNNNNTNMNNYIFNINKSDAIIGGSPPRQQLCFIDSLIANKASNTGSPEAMPGYLVMGTFAPAVDYLTVKKIREDVLKCTHDAAVISSYLTSFGYAATDPQWVVVPPVTTCGSDAGVSGTGGGSGSGGVSGPGGSGSGGRSGTGGASAGGAAGSGGAGKGGIGGSGDVGRGGSSGTGGSATGGNHSAGGVGAAGSGSGGVASSGGVSSSSSGLGGAGGVATSVASRSGGALGAGGTTAGGGPAASSAGCGCELGEISRRAGPWSLMPAVGIVVAGMLRRLIMRRGTCAKDARSPDGTGGPEIDQLKQPSDESMS